MRQKIMDQDGSYCLVDPGNPPKDLYLPYYLRSIGYNARRQGIEEFVPAGQKNFVEIFWGEDGEGEFFHPEVPGHPSSVMRAGDFFYRLPNEEHHFIARTKLWRYHWLTFDGPLAQSFMEAFHYPRHCFPAGRFPHDLFNELYARFHSRTPHDWRMMVTEIATFLIKAGEADEQTPDRNLVEKAIAICQAEFADNNLNINTLASRLDIDRKTLLRAFQRYMRQKPSEYLYRVRLQAALEMLNFTHESVAAIAAACGFQEANYFCRFLKKYTGTTAAAIRRAHTNALLASRGSARQAKTVVR